MWHGNPAADLWNDDLQEAPGFTDEYLAYWSPDEFVQYFKRIHKWCYEHGKSYSQIAKLNLRQVLMRDRFSYQLEAAFRLDNYMGDNLEFLVSHRGSVQQLCDEVGQKQWIGFAELNPKEIKKLSKGFSKLKYYSLAMRSHNQKLVDDKLTYRRLEKINLDALVDEAIKAVFDGDDPLYNAADGSKNCNDLNNSKGEEDELDF